MPTTPPAYPLWFPITGKMAGNFGDGRGHEGYDLFGPDGADVFAAAEGVVSRHREQEDDRSYGLYIDIAHGAGFVTRYAHLKDYVAPNGARVTRGQHIAFNGSSGSAQPGAAHVHFEVLRNGAPQNLNHGMPPRNAPITARAPIPVEIPGFPAGHVTPPPPQDLRSLSVVDFKNPAIPKGRKRFVRVVPDPAKKQFRLVTANGAKIAGHPSSPATGVAVTQPSNGAVLGVELHPNGVAFVVTADDGGTFDYRFEA